MKYLKMFESDNNTSSIVDEIDSIKYILEDEGISPQIVNHFRPDCSVISVKFIPMDTRHHRDNIYLDWNKFLENSEFILEFIDRLEESWSKDIENKARLSHGFKIKD